MLHDIQNIFKMWGGEMHDYNVVTIILGQFASIHL